MYKILFLLLPPLYILPRRAVVWAGRLSRGSQCGCGASAPTSACSASIRTRQLLAALFSLLSRHCPLLSALCPLLSAYLLSALCPLPLCPLPLCPLPSALCLSALCSLPSALCLSALCLSALCLPALCPLPLCPLPSAHCHLPLNLSASLPSGLSGLSSLLSGLSVYCCWGPEVRGRLGSGAVYPVYTHNEAGCWPLQGRSVYPFTVCLL
jgi:hypothetical protein